MEMKVLCRNCEKHYIFFDDDGSILTQGCDLDLPNFDGRIPVVCMSYRKEVKK